MTTLPNTDTDQVGTLITTELGNASLGAYQLKHVAPFVYGTTFEGDTVTEDSVAAAPAEGEGAVVSPVPVVEAPAVVTAPEADAAPAVATAENEGLSVGGVVTDIEDEVKKAEAEAAKLAREAEAEAEKVAKDAEAEAKQVEDDVVAEAEKVPGFAERILHDVEGVLGSHPAPAAAPEAPASEGQ